MDHRRANCGVKEKEKCEAFVLQGKERALSMRCCHSAGNRRQASHHQSLERHSSQERRQGHGGFSPGPGGGREGESCAKSQELQLGRESAELREGLS